MIQAAMKINEQRAEIWFFKINVCLDNYFSGVLNASKQQLERTLSTVSVIS